MNTSKPRLQMMSGCRIAKIWLLIMEEVPKQLAGVVAEVLPFQGEVAGEDSAVRL